MNRHDPLHLAFFGSSLVSSYWNGAASYYRGITRALHGRGHRVTFYEPDAFKRQQHRDLEHDPAWADVVVYEPTVASMREQLQRAADADVLIKCSGVGVLDAELEAGVLEERRGDQPAVFWDVDAPATLERMHADRRDPFRALVPRYDLVLTYGGGRPVTAAYEALGARRCEPVYNAVDLDIHGRAAHDERFAGHMGLMANRLPDREQRIDTFFFDAAERCPRMTFVLGGSGWDDKPMPDNVRYVGHVYTAEHNAFNRTPLAVLNVSRQSMADYGFSPATRVFEAAGSGACLITDAWRGVDRFLTPGEEVLVAADGAAVAEHLRQLDAGRAQRVGAAARRRVQREHTYDHRAEHLEQLLHEAVVRRARFHPQNV